MKDIVELNQGEDMKLYDSIVAKAGNVLSIQLGDLEYSPDFGVDLKFFLDENFQFQNESFTSYLVQRLTESQVNVAKVIDVIKTLTREYTYHVGDIKQSNGGLIV